MIRLPDNLERIEDEAFKGCENLRGQIVNLPENLTYIGKQAFEGTGLSEMELPMSGEG